MLEFFTTGFAAGHVYTKQTVSRLQRYAVLRSGARAVAFSVEHCHAHSEAQPH